MKPTELLALNLPTLPAAIIQWRVTPDVPKRANIGRDATGQFCTAQLKEYPPAFCGALAQATFDAVSGASSADIPGRSRVLSMLCEYAAGFPGIHRAGLCTEWLTGVFHFLTTL